LDEARLNNHTEIGHANVSLNCEEPKGYLPDEFLLSWWRIVYWISQLLTWIVLPLMQSYSTAGDFTFTGKECLKTIKYLFLKFSKHGVTAIFRKIQISPVQ
jgi:hypothetical protein